MPKSNLATKAALLLGALLVANCGDDESNDGDGGGARAGSAGSAGRAGSTGSAGDTSSGGTNEAGTGTGGMTEGGSGGVDSGEAGEGPGPGGAGAGGAAACTPIDDFAAAYAQAICDKRDECCGNSATCVDDVTAALVEIYPELSETAADGAVEFDCAAFEQCVTAIGSADCADWPKELGEMYGMPVAEPACRSMLDGQVAPGGACLADYQCDGGYCETTLGETEDTVCVALIADGEACDDGDQAMLCDLSRSYCNADDECAPRLANGEACTAGTQCQSRICDTEDTEECIAPDEAQCEYVPADACSVSPGRARGSLVWPLVLGALVLGAAARRRRFVSVAV